MVNIPHSNYFEGVLQLRNPSQRLLDYVIDTVQEDDRAAITKIKKVKNGFDYYLTSQKYLQILGKKLKKNFSGQYKLTSTLHTQKKSGEKLYRITILFREYDFKVGDTIEIKGDEYVVVQITTKILCKDARSGKKMWFTPEEIGS